MRLRLNYLVAVGALCGACGGESSSNRQTSAGSGDEAGAGGAQPSGGAERGSGGHDSASGGRAPGGASGTGGAVVGFGGAGTGGAALGGNGSGDGTGGLATGGTGTGGAALGGTGSGGGTGGLATGGAGTGGIQSGGAGTGGASGDSSVGGAIAGGRAGAAGDGSGGSSGTAGGNVAGEGGAAGAGGSNIAGAGGVECSDLDCEDCPLGYLRDAQGCDTCVCLVPPLIMETDGVERAPAHVGLTTGFGWAPGSGRVGFSFEWLFDDPATEDEEHFVTVQLEAEDSVLLGMDAVRTFHLPSTNPQIGVSGYRASYTSSVAFPLTLVDGYLTVYPSASMQYTGGVYLELQTEDGERVVVAGAFDTTEA